MLGLFRGKRVGRADRRRGPGARRGHRPVLEGLEARIALATDTWTGAVSGSWMTAGNWVGGVAPVPGDDLSFPAAAANLINTNDFPSGTTFNSITILGPGYSLAGNALNLTAGITANYTGTSSDAIDTALTSVVAPVSVSSNTVLDLTGVLSGSAGLNVTGGGTLDLTGVNNYTGPTTVGSGTRLLVDGTTAGVQNNGGLLAGNGTVGGVSSVGGTILAGHPVSSTSTQPTPGQLTANGSVTLDSGSTFGAVLNGTAPGNGVTGYSQLIVSSGLVSLGGATLDRRPRDELHPGGRRPVDDHPEQHRRGGQRRLRQPARRRPVTASSSLFRISYQGPNGSGNNVVLTQSRRRRPPRSCRSAARAPASQSP